MTTEVRFTGARPSLTRRLFWSTTSEAKSGIYRPYSNPTMSICRKHIHLVKTPRLTAYDSPAMWNPLPWNFGKFWKKIATNAAISFAASSVVPFRPHILSDAAMQRINEDIPLLRHIPRRRNRHLLAGRRRRHWHSSSTRGDDTLDHRYQGRDMGLVASE